MRYFPRVRVPHLKSTGYTNNGAVSTAMAVYAFPHQQASEAQRAQGLNEVCLSSALDIVSVLRVAQLLKGAVFAFEGLLHGEPERTMTSTSMNSGGRVEQEVHHSS
jgi:hypothetical protein